MTSDEAIETACAIVSLAYHSIGDYSTPSDGFCRKCPYSGEPEHFRNDGKALEYVRLAVLENLRRDGFKVSDYFNSVTGIPR